MDESRGEESTCPSPLTLQAPIPQVVKLRPLDPLPLLLAPVDESLFQYLQGLDHRTVELDLALHVLP
jgi:hypothetical protein